MRPGCILICPLLLIIQYKGSLGAPSEPSWMDGMSEDPVTAGASQALQAQPQQMTGDQLDQVDSLLRELQQTVDRFSNSQVTPEQLEEVWQEVEQGQASVSRVEGEVEDLARKVGAAQGQVEAALGQVAASISGGQAAIESVLEEGLRAMDTKLERVKEDLLERLEVKEKRSLEQGSLITKEQMDQVSRELHKLKTRNVTSMLSVSQAVSQTELAQFRLMVSRDTARLRFSEGEWVTVQARGQHGNPADYFARPMSEYVSGFGDPSKEFWLGLDKLAALTRGGAKLNIQLETSDGKTIYASYENFEVSGPEYIITATGYRGTAGDTLRIDNGMAFSAMDLDLDRWSGDCASTRGGGGWWFNGCGLANLNGRNLGEGREGYEGILWYFYGKDNRSFRASKMAVSRK